MKRFFTAIAGLILAGPPAWWLARACAPDFKVAVLSYSRHPDLPRTGFIDGRLGILQPTFARSYLIIAYRYLNGIGLNSQEREQARDYYFDRATGSWDHLGTDWEYEWESVRSRIKTPAAPRVLTITGGTLSYNPETHSFALNCALDAYRVALHTLQDRRGRYGVASPAFRSWLSAQDRVFSNCLGSGGIIPEPATPNLPVLIRKDRDYQIAAANFYAGRYQTAIDEFRGIGRDESSPWNQIARYLVVRALLRRSDAPDSKGDGDTEIGTDSDAILADPGLKTIQGMTWNLVKRAKILERNHEYFRTLAGLLSSRGQDDGLREELWNYTDLYDHVIGRSDPNGLHSYFEDDIPVADPANFRDSDLSNWLYTFQSRAPSAYGRALARWRQTRSQAWLLAALVHATPRQARESGVLQAAKQLRQDSPAYMTARFLSLRDDEELGGKIQARDALDALLADPAMAALPSSVNLLRGLRMTAAPDFHDFLAFMMRKPVLTTWDTDTAESPFDDYLDRRRPVPASQMIDRDGEFILNRDTPLRLLRQAALGDQLPVELRGEALLTAFTRALILNADGSDLAERLAETRPDTGPLVKSYLAETTPEGRRFAAAFLLLHRPEARPYMRGGISRQTPPGRIDDYRDNWWCPIDIQVELDFLVTNPYVPFARKLPSPSAPDFLQGQTATEASEEFAKMSAAGPAVNFLGGIVLPYVQARSDDPRVPEALHLLVQAGKLGCADANSSKIARAAFQTLQANYPKSVWAKRTPYWYENFVLVDQTLKERRDALKAQQEREAQ